MSFDVPYSSIFARIRSRKKMGQFGQGQPRNRLTVIVDDSAILSSQKRLLFNLRYLSSCIILVLVDKI